MKTVQVYASTLDGLEASVMFRMSSSDTWRESPWIPINHLGWAMLQVAGSEFKVQLRSVTGDELSITGLEVAYNQLDNRNRRGIRVNQSNG